MAIQNEDWLRRAYLPACLLVRSSDHADERAGQIAPLLMSLIMILDAATKVNCSMLTKRAPPLQEVRPKELQAMVLSCRDAAASTAPRSNTLGPRRLWRNQM